MFQISFLNEQSIYLYIFILNKLDSKQNVRSLSAPNKFHGSLFLQAIFKNNKN